MNARAAVLAGVVAMVPFAHPAVAQTGDALDVRIDRDLAPRTLVAGDLSVALLVTITERQTGRPLADRFDVVALATNRQGEQTITYPCGFVRDNDPQAPPGVYACTVIVDHGGPWTFVAVVNKQRLDTRQPPVTLARGSADFDIRGGTLGRAAGQSQQEVNGRFGEVALLWSHSVVAAGWLAVVALIGLLSYPGARRHLSTAGLHRLEDRLDFMLKSMWAATALTVGSGIYLMLNQTAYKTPFSSSGIDGVFSLPYGRPYFLSLAAKLAFYAAMIVAAVLLGREARRQRRLVADGSLSPPRRSRSVEPSLWEASRVGSHDPKGAAAVKTAPETDTGLPEAVSQPDRSVLFGVRMAGTVMAIGVVGVWTCVTLLKYFHELIEAARL